MKNVLVVFLGLVLLGQIVPAETVEDTDCFKYYDFQHGLIFDDLMTEKASYSPGDDVVATYTLLSQMQAPIVEGSVRVQIFYNDEKGDEQMIDEFFAAKDINMEYKSTVNRKFSWTVPKGAKAGKYSIKTYFIVGEYFNLAGLSLIPYGPPGVPGEMTSFDVESADQESMMYFSKESTLINDVAYKFLGVPDIYEPGQPLTLKTRLVNVGPEKSVKVSFKVYAWDDLVERPIDKYTSEKTVSLPANGGQDLAYGLPDLGTSTYEVRITAESAPEKALLKVRVPVKGPKGRFIFLGMDKFPLVGGQETTLFLCYSGSTDYESRFNGRGSLELVDGEGNTVYKQDYGPFEVLATPPQGKKVTFTPTKDANYIVLKGDMYDESGALNDRVSLTYDYSKFANIPAKMEVKLSRDAVGSGQPISYIVTYTDEKGAPLRGKALVYLVDPEGKIINAVSDKDIAGTLTGDFVVAGRGGEYKIIARELVQDKKAEASFRVDENVRVTASTQAPAPTTTLPEKMQDNSTYILLAGVVMILAIVFFLWIKGKKKQ